jgi:hypothetical protein
MLDDQCPQPVQLMSPKTTGLRKPHGVKPKLRDTIALLDVDVRRFRSFKAIE